MEAPNFTKENLAFSKSAIKLGFDALSAFTGQAAIASDILLGASPIVPEEAKKAASIYFKSGQKCLDSLRTHVEKSLDLDWTSKNAPLKNLDEMEGFYKDAFSQADEIKKETKVLFEKATKPFPKEARSFFDSWNESVTSSFDFYQDYVTKNFEFARKVLTESSVFTRTAEPKASTK